MKVSLRKDTPYCIKAIITETSDQANRIIQAMRKEPTEAESIFVNVAAQNAAFGRYNELIKGGDVAIIGGAPKHDQHAYNYSHVIGFNHHALTLKDEITIWYYDAKPDISEHISEFRKLKFMHICIFLESAGRIAAECERLGIDYAFYGFPIDQKYLKDRTTATTFWPMLFAARFDFFPLTGTLALWHILQFKVKDIFVTGMDLYKNDLTPGLPGQKGPHDIAAHKHWLKVLWESNGFILYDSQLLTCVCKTTTGDHKP